MKRFTLTTLLCTTAAGLLMLTSLATKNLPAHFQEERRQVPEQRQIHQYDPGAPKTIVELQPFRQSDSVPVRRAGKEGTATLINLNPAINVWHLLKVAGKDGSAEAAYHLENPEPRSQKLTLDANSPSGVVIANGTERYRCDLFGTNALEQAKVTKLIYAPLCGGRIYLRNTAAGHRTNLEAATEFLRDRIWGGEKIVSLGHILMGEAHRETGEMGAAAQAAAAENPGSPLPALIDPKFGGSVLKSANLGIDWEGPQRTGMKPGAWYPARGNPGVYVSILQPNLIDPAVLSSNKTAVNNLDNVEASSLSYVIAFDLDRFELGFALGTDHPRVGWSDRILERMKDPALPGPDGIGTIRPLVATGLVSPGATSRTVATFTAGFKRTHGAFKYGALAQMNQGSHYGFIENGVVFSKLQPGLSTLLMFNDGAIEMKTWTDADNKVLARVKHARQNGVPLIEVDSATNRPVPGSLVRQWGPGNWSGSQNGELRSMRSAAALQTRQGKRFLIYAVFSDATPSAMARIFQAYQCDYAMLLDMNALEHTYLAVYRRSGSQMFVDHLLKGMGVLDTSASGNVVPRFLGFADNRDFFYVMRRNGKEVRP